MSVKARVLVVDDDRLVLTTVADGLRAAGFAVDVADSGEQALQICNGGRPDLAILDVRMPLLSGVDLARVLSAQAIPFLFLSAYDEAALVRQALDQGALGYLMKPIDVPKLLPSIDAALAVAATIRQLREREVQLRTALDGDRQTSVSVGVLMERFRLSANQAFETLRRRARSERRPLDEVARELVTCTESLNGLSPLTTGQEPRESSGGR